MEANRPPGAGTGRADDAGTGERRVRGVDERLAERFDWGSIQWLCSGQLFADAQQTCGYVQIAPGRKNPRHYHPNSDEVLFLLEGELDHSLGDAVHHLVPGMAIHIPQGVEHDAANRGDRIARMVVTYPTSDRRAIVLEAGRE